MDQPQNDTARVCAECGADISHKRKNALYCSKACSRKAWKQKNPEKVKEQDARWARDNLQKKTSWHKRWRQENRGRARAGARARMSRWRKENPEKFAIANRSQQHKRRALKSKNTSLYVANNQQIEKRLGLFDGRCSYCNKEGMMTVDHFIPFAKGGTHTPSNLLPACLSCNASKNDSDPEQWFRAQTFFDEGRWQQLLVATGKKGMHHGQLSLV